MIKYKKKNKIFKKMLVKKIKLVIQGLIKRYTLIYTHIYIIQDVYKRMTEFKYPFDSVSEIHLFYFFLFVCLSVFSNLKKF